MRKRASICYFNKDENAHRFASSAIRGERGREKEREREKERKREREREREMERERATNNK